MFNRYFLVCPSSSIALSTKPSLNHCVEELQASKLSETPCWRVLSLSLIVLFLLLKRYLSSYYYYVFIHIYIYVIYTNDICISCADLLCVRHHKVSTGILGRTRPSTKLKPSPLLGFCAVVQLAGANVSQHGVWSKQNWTYPLPVYPNGEMHTDRNKNARAAHGNRMGLY